MPCGAAVDTNGLKSSVIVVSGELSMTRGLDAVLDEPLPELAGVDEHAPTPAASRPTAAMATSPLCVRCVLLISAFPCRGSKCSPLTSGGCELTRKVPAPSPLGVHGRGCDVEAPAGGAPRRGNLEERRCLRAALVDRERAPGTERASALGSRAGSRGDGHVPVGCAVAQRTAQVVGIGCGADQ